MVTLVIGVALVYVGLSVVLDPEAWEWRQRVSPPYVSTRLIALFTLGVGIRMLAIDEVGAISGRRKALCLTDDSVLVAMLTRRKHRVLYSEILSIHTSKGRLFIRGPKGRATVVGFHIRPLPGLSTQETLEAVADQIRTRSGKDHNRR